MTANDNPDKALVSSPDRAVAARFAPAAKRPALLLPVLLDHELAMIERQVSEPMLYRIRLQFWRDALAASDGGGVPLGKALGAVLNDVPAARPYVSALIDVHERYIDEPSQQGDRLEILGAREAELFGAALAVLDASAPESVWLERCGRAYAFARGLCLTKTSENPMPAPDTYLERAEEDFAYIRPNLQALARGCRPAVMPLALVSTYLQAFQGADRSASGPIEISPFRRTWRMWWAGAGHF